MYHQIKYRWVVIAWVILALVGWMASYKLNRTYTVSYELPKPQVTIIPTIRYTAPPKPSKTDKLARAISDIYTSVDITKAKQIVKLTEHHASKHNLSPTLVLGLIAAESSFRRTAVSHVGAKGYTQVYPKWHHDKIKGRDLFDTRVSIEVGTRILKDCFDRRKTVKMALACYNGATKPADIEKYYRSVMQRKQQILQVASM